MNTLGELVRQSHRFFLLVGCLVALNVGFGYAVADFISPPPALASHCDTNPDEDCYSDCTSGTEECKFQEKDILSWDCGRDCP